MVVVRTNVASYHVIDYTMGLSATVIAKPKVAPKLMDLVPSVTVAKRPAIRVITRISM